MCLGAFARVAAASHPFSKHELKNLVYSGDTVAMELLRRAKVHFHP